MTQDEANAELADADMFIDKLINSTTPPLCPRPGTANGDSPNTVDDTTTVSA